MKLGLVLEGGANRAYFSVGVMDALIDLGIKADYIIGVSAGIANAISYASNQRGRSIGIGLTYLNDKRYMGCRHFLSKENKSYYNKDFIFNQLPNIYAPFDYDALNKYDGEIYAGVTSLDTGECEYLKIDGTDKSWTAITASCALPLMFPPVEYNGKTYFDGGISNPIPFEKALQDGCDKIIVILTRPRIFEKRADPTVNLCRFLYRKHQGFSKALKERAEKYNILRERLFELEKEGKAIVIAPDNTDSWKRTERNSKIIKEMYDEGYEKAIKTVKKEL
ncbi:MAG: patatin family protein [Clostridia bacterium]|nr:patatin family protein [Clostridia bacterium]